MSKKNDNNALFFLSGAILGAAAAYYLHTPAGKKLVTEVSNKTNDIKKAVEQNSTELAEKVQDSVQMIMEKSGHALESAREKMNETVDSTKEEIEEQVSAFEVGIQKAKNKLNTANNS